MIKGCGKRGDIVKLKLSEVIEHWNQISPLVGYPKNEKQYNKLVEQLDELLDIVGNNENHKLMGLVDVMSHFVKEYEETHYAKNEKQPTGIDALKFLMQMHDLDQSSLPEIGSQGVISEILSGKRDLNLRQIKLLAKRFGVSTATFID